MKEINLTYWNSDNYGDAINPLLIGELSGLHVQPKCIGLSRKQRIKIILKGLLTFNYKEIATILFPWDRTLFCIGSIMDSASTKSTIWGTGFMNETDQFKGGKILAVRGKESIRKLESEGYKECSIYGDPALLLPLWIPAIEKKYSLGLIPHWKEVDYFIEKFGKRYHIIDLRTKDVLRVTQEISSCEYVMSTSLHGLIVSHAYGIPALWIKKGYIDTDGFKFRDYFSSVDIPFYNGFENIEEILQSDENCSQLFQNNRDKVLINNSLHELQLNLLKTAPFRLKEKYEALCADI